MLEVTLISMGICLWARTSRSWGSNSAARPWPMRSAPMLMAGAGALTAVLKLYFRRVRPDLPWAFVHEPSYSFPSGHSVLAVAVYGSLIFLGMRHLARTWERMAVCVVAGTSILGIGISRIYLGVHYPSD